MSTNDEQQYLYVLEQLHDQSPNASRHLREIYAHYGSQASYLAASALVWLIARSIALGDCVLTDFSDHALKSFSYFHAMQSQPDAIELFRTMIQAFSLEYPSAHEE